MRSFDFNVARPSLVLACIALAACGGQSGDPGPTSGEPDLGVLVGDASMHDAIGRDGGSVADQAPGEMIPMRRCDPTKPFGEPIEVPELQGISELYFASSVWLDASETTMIVTGRPRFDDGGKLYTLTRPDTSSPFSAPELIAGVDKEGRSEWCGAMSADGLALFFSVALREPFKATRPDTGSPFSEGARIAPKMSTEYRRFVDPRPSARGVYLRIDSELHFLAHGADYTEVALTGAFVSGYSISEDELTLYYSSSRPPKYRNELFRVTRSSVDQAFDPTTATPFALEDIVSGGAPDISWVSEDECVLYSVVSKRDTYDSYPHDVVLRAERPL